MVTNKNTKIEPRTASVSPEPRVEQELNYDHQCYICDKIFSANSNLNRHLRKIHQETVQSPYNNIKCTLCHSQHPSSALYRQHLQDYHKINIEIEERSFESKESFQEWKFQVERETTSQFIKSRGEKKSKIVKTYFSCNRSGNYVSKAKTNKALKKQGTRKINGRCPASMQVTINGDDTCDVKFFKTHVGHDFELKHIDISEKDREFIVEKLESGCSKRDLIKEIRSSQNQLDDPTELTAFDSTGAPIELIVVNASDMELDQASSEIIIDSSNCEIKALTPDYLTARGVDNPDTPSTNATTTYFQLATENYARKQLKSRLHLATSKDILNIMNSKKFKRKQENKQQATSTQQSTTSPPQQLSSQLSPTPDQSDKTNPSLTLGDGGYDGEGLENIKSDCHD